VGVCLRKHNDRLSNTTCPRFVFALQYEEMPTISGSWSHESIGFEDRSGTQGVQISYAEVPAAGTAYQIPPACHVEAGVAPADSCCSSMTCQCEEVMCEVVTDFSYNWIDISTNGLGTRITDATWEQNNDDGWWRLQHTSSICPWFSFKICNLPLVLGPLMPRAMSG
jgi:hypothetical protein